MIKPGTLLIAHPDIEDEFFGCSVILITEHHQTGTVGLIVNKLSKIVLSEAMGLQEWNLDDDMYVGGPVNPQALIMLHTAGWYSSNTMPVDNNLSISSDLLMTEKMHMGNTPEQFRFVSGMANWQPKQLQTEIDKNRWLTMPSSERIIFESRGEKQWKHAVDAYADIAVSQFF